jgi:hypothetical protein
LSIYRGLRKLNPGFGEISTEAAAFSLQHLWLSFYYPVNSRWDHFLNEPGLSSDRLLWVGIASKGTQLPTEYAHGTPPWMSQ